MAEEKKQTPAQPPTAPPSAPPRPAAPQAAPPRPPVPQARPVPPPPPAAQPVPKNTGRRNFVKALLALSAVLTVIPFVPWGSFLSSTVSAGGHVSLLQKVAVDDLSEYGAAAGQVVNVNDLTTFPANNHWVITYPSSGDPTLDAENPDTFQKYELIRLPESLGGTNMKATDFVAFSKVCVHLWCSPNYVPAAQRYECPCHGSEYEIPDGLAVAGPASLQPFPTNAIPMLSLQADSDGNLYAVNQNRDPRLTFPNDGVPDPIEANGEIGYGRDSKSYYSFILPIGQTPADLAGLSEEITG